MASPLTVTPSITSESDPPTFLGLCTSKSWKEIEELVTPTKTDDEQLQACFNQVQTVFSSLGSVVKAGSFGKGTHVKFKADVDVVVLFAEFQLDQHQMKLDQIKTTALNNPSLFTDIKSTAYSVQFRFGKIDVDILPAMELNDPVRYIQQFKGDPRLAACVSPVQIAFIQAQPRRYRTLVRIVKWWKQQLKWSSRSTLPLSYFLELLVLDVYNQYAQIESSTEFVGLFQRVLEVLVGEQRIIRFNAFYHLDKQSEEVNKFGDLRFIVMDPANPYKNVADNLTDAFPLVEYATNTLRDLKISMAMKLKEYTDETERRLQGYIVEVTRQRRVSALLMSLMCMKRSIVDVLKLPDLEKMTNELLSKVLTFGPFTFQFVAFIECVERKTPYPTTTKFLQLRLIVGVSTEWLELRTDLQNLQNGIDPWPTIEVTLQFKKSHQQQLSDKLVINLSKPASVIAKQNYPITTSATIIKYGSYSSHSLDLVHFRYQSQTEVQCGVTLNLTQ